MLQYTGIGDLIWHIHYFKMIAEQSRDGKVTVVAQPSTLAKAFIGHEPWVEAIIDHDHRPRRGEQRKGTHSGLSGMRKMAQQLKAGQFDRILLFSGRISRGLIAWMSDIPVRQGYGYKFLQRIFLNKPPYISAYKGTSLAVYPEASAFMIKNGFCNEPLTPKMAPSPDWVDTMKARFAHLPRPFYALAIGTSEQKKQWGANNFAKLSDQLLNENAGVILLGGPNEAQLANDIAKKVTSSQIQNLCILTDAPVQGSTALLSIVDACIGNDTGMINVSAAVGTPSFVVIRSGSTLDHDPVCLQNIEAPSLNDITVDRVLMTVKKTLQHRSQA